MAEPEQQRQQAQDHPSERDLEALVEGEAGVGTAMRVFEQAERVYYGAVLRSTPRAVDYTTRADTTAN